MLTFNTLATIARAKMITELTDQLLAATDIMVKQSLLRRLAAVHTR